MTSARKKVLLVLIGVVALLVTCGLYVWQSVPLVRFEPVRMDKHQHLQVSKETLTKEQADRVEAVLRQYGKLYRLTDSGAILITLRLSSNTELI